MSLLECDCGCPGCWPFLVRITLTEDEIIWSDFEQPHRGVNSTVGEWTYDNLKPFVFNRNQYEEELKRVSDKVIK